jgi:hypothetical protein
MTPPSLLPFAPFVSATLRRAMLPGAVSAVSSAATAAWRARKEGASAWVPLNDVTHTIWPDEAQRASNLSVRHTLFGFAIHTAASIFWAAGYDVLRAPRERPAPRRDAATAAAIAATAWCVDYHVVPKRLTPGFEAHLSKRSLAWVYGALALGLFAGACASRARDG